MTRKQEEIERVIHEVNSAKSRLLTLAGRLDYVGARRQAKSLYTIIGRLEAWQSTAR